VAPDSSLLDVETDEERSRAAAKPSLAAVK